MIKIKFMVMNKPWTLRLMKTKKFKKKHGNALGATKGWKREIDLHPGGFDQETIDHEIYHAYRGEMCQDTKIEEEHGDNHEEFAAELHAKRAREMIALGEDLFKQVYELTTKKRIK